MIETIYNSENSENRKPDVNIRLPKNIRQIGQSDVTASCQIYIEENVFAYIKKEPEKSEKLRYGVLLGEKKQGNGYIYIFVNGMIDVDDIIENTIIFSDDVWTGIYDNIRRYYKNAMVVGWFASTDSDILKDMHNIRKIHLDHFAGNGKVFLNINREEADEAFYIYERNGLRRQPCYHVYFEKSYEFEDYLFGTGRNITESQVKQTMTKETGKYGIAINNNNMKNSVNVNKAEKTPENSEEGLKLSDLSKYKRVASFVTILALAGVIGFMGKEGQLDALQNKMEGLVGNILNKDDKGAENIISVNGNPTETQTPEPEAMTVNNQPESTDSKEEETTSTNNEENNDETETATKNEQISETNTAGQEVNQSNTKQESETTTVPEDNGASVSVPNTNYETYIVKAGETLYSIAVAKYGTADKIEEIMELNKMDNENYVMEGQKILLP